VWEGIKEKFRESSKGIHPAQLTPGNGGLKHYPRQGNLLAVKTTCQLLQYEIAKSRCIV
jgi:hypothetical protein